MDMDDVSHVIAVGNVKRPVFMSLVQQYIPIRSYREVRRDRDPRIHLYSSSIQLYSSSIYNQWMARETTHHGVCYKQ